MILLISSNGGFLHTPRDILTKIHKVQNLRDRYIRRYHISWQFLQSHGSQLNSRSKRRRTWRITLRVMLGSPENSALVFEIAKFSAGRLNLARRKMSSSFSSISLFSSTIFLKHKHQSHKKHKSLKHNSITYELRRKNRTLDKSNSTKTKYPRRESQSATRPRKCWKVQTWQWVKKKKTHKMPYLKFVKKQIEIRSLTWSSVLE